MGSPVNLSNIPNTSPSPHKEETHLFNNLLRILPKAILVLDPQGTITYCNPEGESFLKYTENELIAQNAQILFPPRFQKKFLLNLRKTVKDSSACEYRSFILEKTKKRRPVNTHLVFLNNQSIILTFKDLSTEQLLKAQYRKIKAINDTLRQEQAQSALYSPNLTAVLNSVTDGIVTLDEKGHIESANPAIEKMFGYSSIDLIGRSIAILAPTLESQIKSLILGKKSYSKKLNTHFLQEGEFVAHNRDKTDKFIIHFSLSGFQINETLKFTVIMNDITQLKKNERRLKTANEELERFAYVASHDLKEPLRGIHNYSTFLLEDYKDLLDEAGKEKLKGLLRLSSRLYTLIDALLHYSRIGYTKISKSRVDMNLVIQDVLKTLDMTIQEKQVLVTIQPNFPAVCCNQTLITEVFQNLISNAIKYNDKKKKTLEIEYLAASSSLSDEEWITFYVRDNGIGIQEKHFNDIFGIFNRLHINDTYGSGSGAGLTIVKKIIEKHKGKIWLESTYGEGTIFYFTLQKWKKIFNEKTEKQILTPECQ